MNYQDITNYNHKGAQAPFFNAPNTVHFTYSTAYLKFIFISIHI